MFKGLRKNLNKKIKNIFKTKQVVLSSEDKTTDHINIDIGGLHLSVKHETTSEIPTELSVILPRIEMRDKCSFAPPTKCTSREIILNSISIILSPRNPKD